VNKVTWELALRTVSEANSSEHWTAKSTRHKRQQFFIRQAFARESQKITLPCTITFVRLGPREMDDDNLAICFKYIRDELSECLIPEKRSCYVNAKGKTIKIKGRADSDPRIKWRYSQEKSATHGIRVEIEFNKENIENVDKD